MTDLEPELVEFEELEAPAEEAPLPETVYVTFSAPVVQATTELLLLTLGTLANRGVETVHLLLSTSGGGVMEGFNLYNVAQGLPFHLVTHNVGNVDSIGFVVFLAGTERYACRNSTFMFHPVAYPERTGLNERTIAELLADATANQKRITDVTADRTRLKKSQIAELYRQESRRNAEWALEVGIIDEIRDVEIPPEAMVLTVTLPTSS